VVEDDENPSLLWVNFDLAVEDIDRDYNLGWDSELVNKICVK